MPQNPILIIKAPILGLWVYVLPVLGTTRLVQADCEDTMEARVADLMELQEAAKNRRRGVLEKDQSVNRRPWTEASLASETLGPRPCPP